MPGETKHVLTLNVMCYPICLAVLASLDSRKSLSCGLWSAQMAGELLTGHFLFHQCRSWVLSHV